MTREEMETLLSDGIGGPGVVLDRHYLERDVRFLLSQAKDDENNPVDIGYLDNKGPKNIADLCEELLQYECMVRVSRETGRFQRLAHSLKLHIHAEGFALREEMRRYDNGKEIKTNELFAFSETILLFRSMDHISAESRANFRKMLLGIDASVDVTGHEFYGEQLAEAAQRALLQEPEIYIQDRGRFDLDAFAGLNRSINDPRILRESRVFIGAQSRVATYHALLLLHMIPFLSRMGYRYRDLKVWIYNSWKELTDSIDRDRSLKFSARIS